MKFSSSILARTAFATAFVLPVLPAAIATPTITKLNLGSVQPNSAYNRFIITYREGSSERSQASSVISNVNAAVARAGLYNSAITTARSGALGISYDRKVAGGDLVRTSRKLSATEAKKLMTQLASDPAVLHVQADVMRRAITDIKASKSLDAATFTTANDTFYETYQWHLRPGTGTSEMIGRDTVSFANWGGADTSGAWALADGAGVTIAVIDTGLTHHPDIDLSLADEGYDFITDAYVSGRDTDGRASGGWDLGDWTTDPKYYTANGGCVDPNNPNALPESSSWHGTHVSGTIAELTNNDMGMAGSAFNAKILPVRALGHCGGYDSDIADAIEWASGGHVEGIPDNVNPVQVISMSLGGDGACNALDVEGVAIADAISRGVTVVVAAGNSAADVANFTPASCPGVIAVAANGITGKRAFYSNYGSGVTLSAPGGGVYTNDTTGGEQVDAGFVWSAINDGTTTPDEDAAGYIYGGFAGTSQATPHVAGAVALVIGAMKEAGLTALTPAQIKTLMSSTARTFPSTPDQTIGAGIVDAAAAVNAALGNITSPPDSDPVELINGALLTAQSGSIGHSLIYSLSVPSGAKSLSLRTLGGTGDVSLYVSIGNTPAADGSDATYKSVKTGNNEAVVLPTPVAGTYYLRVVGVTDFKNVSILGNYTAP
jgi:serine protease